jgi:hypothetical protein
MAQYLLSVWHDDDYELDFSTHDAMRRMEQVGGFNGELERADALVFACGLHPAGTASVASWSDGRVVESDGPYSSSPRTMGGFWVVEAATPDAAREWARRAAAACEGPVEVRALQG